MRAGDVSEDEFVRAVQPKLDALAGQTFSNVYWAELLDRLQSRPTRTARSTVAAREAALRSITRADLVAAANVWLTDESSRSTSRRSGWSWSW